MDTPTWGRSEFSGAPRRIASEWSLIAPAEAFQWGHRPPEGKAKTEALTSMVETPAGVVVQSPPVKASISHHFLI